MAGTVAEKSVTYMTVPLTENVRRQVNEVAAHEKRSTGEVILQLLESALSTHHMNGSKSKG